MMKINKFQGELTDISAKKAALVSTHLNECVDIFKRKHASLLRDRLRKKCKDRAEDLNVVHLDVAVTVDLF